MKNEQETLVLYAEGIGTALNKLGQNFEEIFEDWTEPSREQYIIFAEKSAHDHASITLFRWEPEELVQVLLKAARLHKEGLSVSAIAESLNLDKGFAALLVERVLERETEAFVVEAATELRKLPRAESLQSYVN